MNIEDIEKLFDKKLGQLEDRINKKFDDEFKNLGEKVDFFSNRLSFIEMANSTGQLPEAGVNRYGPRGNAAGETRGDWRRERYGRR